MVAQKTLEQIIIKKYKTNPLRFSYRVAPVASDLDTVLD